MTVQTIIAIIAILAMLEGLFTLIFPNQARKGATKFAKIIAYYGKKSTNLRKIGLIELIIASLVLLAIIYL